MEEKDLQKEFRQYREMELRNLDAGFPDPSEGFGGGVCEEGR